MKSIALQDLVCKTISILELLEGPLSQYFIFLMDEYAHVPPGRSLAYLLDYSDDDSDDSGYLDMKTTKQGQAILTHGGTNTQGEATSLAKFQPAQHKNVDSSVLARIHIEGFGPDRGFGGGSGGAKANDRVVAEMCEATLSNRAARRAGPKEVDRSERATVENVMDPRTRLLLYKLVNSNTLREIHGCVSTGKEANVYYALSGDGSAAAVKVFKTSILAFKDRDKYVAGEFRFQRYCKSNPRKMVRTWAEKEARNLSRLQEGGVLAPAVKLLRQHILIMEFLGEDGWPAPRLKEVQFPSLAALDQCYLDLCCTIRKMYGRCRLIHGDLSEYNLLLFRGRVVVIDVSQSVEHDHPLAMDFLRRDLVNVTNFFRSQGHRELFSLQDLFHFVTAEGRGMGWERCTGPDNTDDLMTHLRELREERRDRIAERSEEQATIDEQVFLRINVPRTLTEFSDTKAPNAEMVQFIDRMTAEGPTQPAAGDTSPGAEKEVRSASEEEEENGLRRHVDPGVCLANMSKEERKEHKKNVKEAQRLRREEKKKNGDKHKKKKGKH
eukprot:gene901-529_t